MTQDQRNSTEGGERADCYAAGERGLMTLWQQWRGAALRPLLATLHGLHIGPDHLTILSALAGIAFCPLVFWSRPWSLVALAIHVILDGLDGPLARYGKTASRRGSFSDSMSDQLVVVASTIALMLRHDLSVLPGAIYIAAYTVVLLFSMARNFMAIPYSWLVRPRLVVYAWLAVEWYLWPGSLEPILWGCNVVLLIHVASGFVRIRNRI